MVGAGVVGAAGAGVAGAGVGTAGAGWTPPRGLAAGTVAVAEGVVAALRIFSERDAD